MHNVANPPTTKSQKVIDPARTEAATRVTPATKRRTTATVSVGIGLAYERFLKLSVPAVLSPLVPCWCVLLGVCVFLVFVVI